MSGIVSGIPRSEPTSEADSFDKIVADIPDFLVGRRQAAEPRRPAEMSASLSDPYWGPPAMRSPRDFAAAYW